MSELSAKLVGMENEGNGEICWLSCGVHVAGENVNREDFTDDSVESDVNSSESENLGTPPRVLGTKWSTASSSMFAGNWLDVSLVQGASFGS